MTRLTVHLDGKRRKINVVKMMRFQVYITEKLLVLLAKFGNKTENPVQGSKQEVPLCPLPLVRATSALRQVGTPL